METRTICVKRGENMEWHSQILSIDQYSATTLGSLGRSQCDDWEILHINGISEWRWIQVQALIHYQLE